MQDDLRAIVEFDDNVDDQTGREVRRQMMGENLTDYQTENKHMDAFDWTEQFHCFNPTLPLKTQKFLSKIS